MGSSIAGLEVLDAAGKIDFLPEAQLRMACPQRRAFGAVAHDLPLKTQVVKPSGRFQHQVSRARHEAARRSTAARESGAQSARTIWSPRRHGDSRSRGPCRARSAASSASRPSSEAVITAPQRRSTQTSRPRSSPPCAPLRCDPQVGRHHADGGRQLIQPDRGQGDQRALETADQEIRAAAGARAARSVRATGRAAAARTRRDDAQLRRHIVRDLVLQEHHLAFPAWLPATTPGSRSPPPILRSVRNQAQRFTFVPPLRSGRTRAGYPSPRGRARRRDRRATRRDRSPPPRGAAKPPA